MRTHKQELAERFAHLVLCFKGDASACGTCQSCLLLRGGFHPDFHPIQPESKSGQIVVEQIRALLPKLTISGQYSEVRVVVISHADRLNQAAANSLLKALEEPFSGVLIMLVSEFPTSIPATVRSRCQHVVIAAPKFDTARDWLLAQGIGDAESRLTVAQGSPLLARELSDQDRQKFESYRAQWLALAVRGAEPTDVVQQWQADDLGRLIDWMVAWAAVEIRARLRFGQSGSYSYDVFEKFADIPVSLLDLYAWLDALYRAKRETDRQLNKVLVLESLLLRWQMLTN